MSFGQLDPNKGEESPRFPPGFRFHPTDEELVSYYLTQKVLNSNFVFQAIGEVDFNKCEPWDLPAKAKLGHQSTFYFFSLRDWKYPSGVRTNRATEAGYWKATGKDREVISRDTGKVLGMKKTLVFYIGRAANGQRTNWIMHEYRLDGESRPHQQEWVVCRSFEKISCSNKRPSESSDNTGYNEEHGTDQLPSSHLPVLRNLEFPNTNCAKPITLSEPQGYFQWASFPVQKIFRRSHSSLKAREELQLADTLENLISGWDMGSPVPNWDISTGPS